MYFYRFSKQKAASDLLSALTFLEYYVYCSGIDFGRNKLRARREEYCYKIIRKYIISKWG